MSEFPHNKREMLTMLYLQNIDFNDLSPEDFVDKYDEIHDKICKYDAHKHPTRFNTDIHGGI